MTDHASRTPHRPRQGFAWFERRPRRRGSGPRWPTAGQARRVLALLLFVTAAVLAVQPVAVGGSTAPMLVTARDLTAGSTLRAADLRVVQAPRSVVPAGALSRPQAAVGRVLAGAARTGEPVTDARLVGRTGGRLAGGRGMAAVPVRLSDAAVAELLQPGSKVDVVTVGQDADDSRVLASSATVVTVTTARSPTLADKSHGRLVLIALPTEAATRVAAVSLNQPVTVTLR